MKLNKLISAAVLVSVLGSGVAIAGMNHNEIFELRQSGQILSMEDVLQQARAIQPGQLIEAELEREDGSYVYELKIIDEQGRLHKLELDAKTGEVLKHRTRGRD